MLCATGCFNVTSWSHGKSKYQFWTKLQNPIQEKQIFITLYQMGFLFNNPSNFTETFWSCGLCSECNKCGYEIFASINTIIATHVENESSKEELTQKLNILRRYMRHEYIKDLKITSSEILVHKSCIYHYLSHSFGICNLQYFEICNDCVKLFHFFDLIKNYVDGELYELLDDYLKKLILWLGYHAQKFYLNTHVQVNLDELDEDGAVIIVDYKMRILPHTARKTKSQFFGKRGWTLHSLLVYTKDITSNKLDIQVYDH
ncbi:hypothetical protein GLOIN_2v326913 [Rhizophagus clarus]|uniref:Uncharacterized protein n=1 Tax=Rhizophagus clarus TaxID=94130 RepID=A0A8H3QEI7_9GLOM|nr:hypothetical protein GLOIN_2v326913 [Rhizophagus clarus]